MEKMKLSEKQKEIIKELRDGAEMINLFDGAYIKRENGMTSKIANSTFSSLTCRNLINIDQHFKYHLTDLGRTIEIE